ncbi:PiggyBac transposable element-derived protein 4 [Elysia marginata]|uniref:PiggyBac transposable element-derived protein 4 n=1 Tax=Elysia marginata TaxID=1093978 RepID=A0AAV4IZA5_9GAST|nr:PiggyBac transposable element-derived protein 4 [Elysia marginata]
MIQKVVCCTNLEGERVYGKNWGKTDATEIEGFVGCLLHFGTLRDNRTTTTVLWDKTNGNQLLRACFSRNRFLKLSNHLRFDDKSTRQSRRLKDAFAPFREIWDDFNLNLEKEYIPGPMLKVDEQLMPCRGRCGFLHYLPSKSLYTQAPYRPYRNSAVAFSVTFYYLVFTQQPDRHGQIFFCLPHNLVASSMPDIFWSVWTEKGR